MKTYYYVVAICSLFLFSPKAYALKTMEDVSLACTQAYSGISMHILVDVYNKVPIEHTKEQFSVTDGAIEQYNRTMKLIEALYSNNKDSVNKAFNAAVEQCKADNKKLTEERV